MEYRADEELAHFAHDLRNLLATVIGHADLQAGGHATDGDPELMASLNAIATAAGRASALCEEMLIQARDGEQQVVEVDLGAIAVIAARVFETNLDRRVRLEVLPGKELMVVAEAARLERAILNLLWNARDAVAANATNDPVNEICLSWGGDDDAIWLEVSDSGVGLPEGRIGDLTKAFHSTHDGDEVRGLGLHSVAAAMDAFGGRLLGTNGSNGGGARLKLEFPVQKNTISYTKSPSKA
ncbi:MAG: hypothetical protein COB96_04200 [Planctomycetota bacterium]|nr:MAG: hypothetical protein COB96_04200 [Planctomycetota bacterium]